MTFEKELIQSVKTAMLKQVQDVSYVKEHQPSKKHVPQDVVEKAWASINWDEVIGEIKGEIQNTICRVVVQSMLTETKNDVKSILSVQGVRQKLKVEAYPKIMEVLESVDE